MGDLVCEENTRHNLSECELESSFGDEDSLFYDDESKATEPKKRLLRMFDSDNGGFSSIYQDKVLPKLQNRGQILLYWLMKSNLLVTPTKCEHCKKGQMVLFAATHLHDSCQWKCRTCSKTRSIREGSIFNGLKCSLRSAVRILYGWVKGTDIDLMTNMLGVKKAVVGALYNRAAKLIQNHMKIDMCVIGGPNVVVLIDIYPEVIRNSRPFQKGCRPILCFLEIRSIPQKYWLHPMDTWDLNDGEQNDQAILHVMKTICAVVRPESALVVPSNSSLICFEKFLHFLKAFYPTVTTLEQLSIHSNEERPFASTLETIWKKPLAVCEEAQFYNPDYIEQFLVQHMWTQAMAAASYKYLMGIIVSKTRNKEIGEVCC